MRWNVYLREAISELDNAFLFISYTTTGCVVWYVAGEFVCYSCCISIGGEIILHPGEKTAIRLSREAPSTTD